MTAGGRHLRPRGRDTTMTKPAKIAAVGWLVTVTPILGALALASVRLWDPGLAVLYLLTVLYVLVGLLVASLPMLVAFETGRFDAGVTLSAMPVTGIVVAMHLTDIMYFGVYFLFLLAAAAVAVADGG